MSCSMSVVLNIDIISKTPEDNLMLVMDYLGGGRELNSVNKAMRRTALKHMWREHYLNNPFLSCLFSRNVQLCPKTAMSAVYRHVAQYMHANGLKPPSNNLLIGTAEEFGAAQMSRPPNRIVALVFARLTPLFLRMPENHAFHQLRKRLKEIAKQQDFRMDDLAAPIRDWMNDPSSLSLRSRVRQLDLSQMGLELIPASLRTLPNLEIVDMRDNRVTGDINFEVLRRACPKLKWIRLEGNPGPYSSEESRVRFLNRTSIQINGDQFVPLDGIYHVI